MQFTVVSVFELSVTSSQADEVFGEINSHCQRRSEQGEREGPEGQSY